MMDLNLLEIEKATCGKLVLQGGDGEKQVNGVVLDSRKVEEGCVFLATIGERVDGHKFIGDVFAKGASLVITQKTPKQVEEELDVSASVWGSYLLVEDSFQALKDIAEYYRRKLTIPIVGITGSVGKTSTKEFVAGVLAEKYEVLKTEGNFNNEVGLPLTLLRIRPHHQVAVVEMGISDFGEMHRLSKMARPDICVITNIGQCHLENLKTRDGILQAKTEMFDFMAEDGEICLNGDDDKLSTITEVKGRKPYYFGLDENNKDVYADTIVSKGLFGSDAVLHIKTDMGERQDKVRPKDEVLPKVTDGINHNAEVADGPKCTVDVVGDKEHMDDVAIHCPLSGIHMVINATAAACVAKLLGLDIEQIREGISHVSAIGGRNNLIPLSRYTVIDDCYNANPVSMKAAIDLLAMADTTKIAILGDMFELGDNSDDLHADVGAYAVENGIDRIYCVGENSKHMYDSAVRNIKDSQTTKVYYFANREELLHTLEQEADAYLPQGCTVLVKASHGMQFAEVVEWLKK